MRIKKGGGIVNVPKLKGKIIENGFTNSRFAKAINMPYATFFRRIENNGEDFTIGERERIVKVLNLTGREATDIFLPV